MAKVYIVTEESPDAISVKPKAFLNKEDALLQNTLCKKGVITEYELYEKPDRESYSSKYWKVWITIMGRWDKIHMSETYAINDISIFYNTVDKLRDKDAYLFEDCIQQTIKGGSVDVIVKAETSKEAEARAKQLCENLDLSQFTNINEKCILSETLLTTNLNYPWYNIHTKKIVKHKDEKIIRILELK